MKSKIIFLAALISLSFMALSQPILSEQLITDKLIRMPVGEKWAKDFVGSPYLVDSFMVGNIMIVPDASFKWPIRYNIYQDIMEVRHRGREMQILPNEFISSIELDGHRIVTAEYELDHKNIKGFLFMLDSGKVCLMQKKNIAFEDWRPAKAQEAGPKPATFKHAKDQYFVRMSSGKVVEFRSIKDLESIIPNHRRELNQYIDSEKIKMKEEKLIQLFNYYNQLETPKS